MAAIVRFAEASKRIRKRHASAEPVVKPSRYKPTYFTHNGRLEVLTSAEMKRQLDAEAICERFSEAFIRRLRLMDADKAAVLELLAQGLGWANDEEVAEAETAALSLKRRCRVKPKRGSDGGGGRAS